MPETKDEIMHALPSTLVSGASAFATAWFGIEHYLAHMDWFHDHVRGPQGEILIHSEPTILSNLKSIVRFWKVDNPGKSVIGQGIQEGDLPGGYRAFLNSRRVDDIPAGQRIYKTSEVLDQIELFAKEYGLKDDVAHIQRIREAVPEIMEASTDLTSREPLLHALQETDSKFFSLFYEAVEGHDSHSKARMKVDGDAEKVRQFMKRHNTKVINHVRLPAVAALTAAVVVGVARADIRQQRKEAALEERLDYYHGKIDAQEEQTLFKD